MNILEKLSLDGRVAIVTGGGGLDAAVCVALAEARAEVALFGDDLACALVYLASDASSFVTGSTFYLTGGLMAHG
jgi:NAD(P)-dependent dehydrogenase (short-subunit alcohol dehydrogenase family)